MFHITRDTNVKAMGRITNGSSGPRGHELVKSEREAPAAQPRVSGTRSRNQDHVTEVAGVGDIQTFRSPPWTGMTALVYVVFFAAFLVLVLAIPFLPGRPAPAIPWIAAIMGLPVFGVFGWMSWGMWQRRREEVRTDGSGITWCPRRDRGRTIRWAEVVAIRERALRQRLELIDRSDQRIPLEYRLTDFARLREIVRRHTPQLRERHALLREFRRHALVRWLNPLGGLFFAGLAVAGLVEDELVPGAQGAVPLSGDTVAGSRQRRPGRRAHSNGSPPDRTDSPPPGQADRRQYGRRRRDPPVGRGRGCMETRGN
jgi:hypothetical protein